MLTAKEGGQEPIWFQLEILRGEEGKRKRERTRTENDSRSLRDGLVRNSPSHLPQELDVEGRSESRRAGEAVGGDSVEETRASDP